MQYLDFLSRLHREISPKLYLEIGVRDGKSLARSKSISLAIDPRFNITHEIACDLRLFKLTSDDFFSRGMFESHSRGINIDLAFIDGMHLAEYAFRDFLNCNQRTATDGIIVFDDIIPDRIEITTREPTGGAWTGDVYKLALLLDEIGFETCVVDTRPSGLCLVRPDAELGARLVEESDKLQERLIGDAYALSSVEEIRRQVSVQTPEAGFEWLHQV